MRILAFDIGRRRTGVALLDTENDVPIVLDALRHDSFESLIDAVHALAVARGTDRLVLGLPLLLSGDEGEQVAFVRACGERLQALNHRVEYLDERYSTPRTTLTDGDDAAACALLQTYQKRMKNGI